MAEIFDLIDEIKEFELFKNLSSLLIFEGQIRSKIWSIELLTKNMNEIIENYNTSNYQHIEDFFQNYLVSLFPSSNKIQKKFCYTLILSLIFYKPKNHYLGLYYSLLKNSNPKNIFEYFIKTKNMIFLMKNILTDQLFVNLDNIYLKDTDWIYVLNNIMSFNLEQINEFKELMSTGLKKYQKQKIANLSKLIQNGKYSLSFFMEHFIKKFCQLNDLKIKLQKKSTLNKNIIISEKSLVINGKKKSYSEFLNSNSKKIVEKEKLLAELKEANKMINSYKVSSGKMLGYIHEIDSEYATIKALINEVREILLVIKKKQIKGVVYEEYNKIADIRSIHFLERGTNLNEKNFRTLQKLLLNENIDQFKNLSQRSKDFIFTLKILIKNLKLKIFDEDFCFRQEKEIKNFKNLQADLEKVFGNYILKNSDYIILNAYFQNFDSNNNKELSINNVLEKVSDNLLKIVDSALNVEGKILNLQDTRNLENNDFTQTNYENQMNNAILNKNQIKEGHEKSLIIKIKEDEIFSFKNKKKQQKDKGREKNENFENDSDFKNEKKEGNKINHHEKEEVNENEIIDIDGDDGDQENEINHFEKDNENEIDIIDNEGDDGDQENEINHFEKDKENKSNIIDNDGDDGDRENEINHFEKDNENESSIIDNDGDDGDRENEIYRFEKEKGNDNESDIINNDGNRDKVSERNHLKNEKDNDSDIINNEGDDRNQENEINHFEKDDKNESNIINNHGDDGDQENEFNHFEKEKDNESNIINNDGDDRDQESKLNNNDHIFKEKEIFENSNENKEIEDILYKDFEYNQSNKNIVEKEDFYFEDRKNNESLEENKNIYKKQNNDKIEYQYDKKSSLLDNPSNEVINIKDINSKKNSNRKLSANEESCIKTNSESKTLNLDKIEKISFDREKIAKVPSQSQINNSERENKDFEKLERKIKESLTISEKNSIKDKNISKEYLNNNNIGINFDDVPEDRFQTRLNSELSNQFNQIEDLKKKVPNENNLVEKNNNENHESKSTQVNSIQKSNLINNLQDKKKKTDIQNIQESQFQFSNLKGDSIILEANENNQSEVRNKSINSNRNSVSKSRSRSFIDKNRASIKDFSRNSKKSVGSYLELHVKKQTITEDLKVRRSISNSRRDSYIKERNSLLRSDFVSKNNLIKDNNLKSNSVITKNNNVNSSTPNLFLNRGEQDNEFKDLGHSTLLHSIEVKKDKKLKNSEFGEDFGKTIMINTQMDKNSNENISPSEFGEDYGKTLIINTENEKKEKNSKSPIFLQIQDNELINTEVNTIDKSHNKNESIFFDANKKYDESIIKLGGDDFLKEDKMGYSININNVRNDMLLSNDPSDFDGKFNDNQKRIEKSGLNMIEEEDHSQRDTANLLNSTEGFGSFKMNSNLHKNHSIKNDGNFNQNIHKLDELDNLVSDLEMENEEIEEDRTMENSRIHSNIDNLVRKTLNNFIKDGDKNIEPKRVSFVSDLSEIKKRGTLLKNPNENKSNFKPGSKIVDDFIPNNYSRFDDTQTIENSKDEDENENSNIKDGSQLKENSRIGQSENDEFNSIEEFKIIESNLNSEIKQVNLEIEIEEPEIKNKLSDLEMIKSLNKKADLKELGNNNSDLLTNKYEVSNYNSLTDDFFKKSQAKDGLNSDIKISQVEDFLDFKINLDVLKKEENLNTKQKLQQSLLDSNPKVNKDDFVELKKSFTSFNKKDLSRGNSKISELISEEEEPLITYANSFTESKKSIKENNKIKQIQTEEELKNSKLENSKLENSRNDNQTKKVKFARDINSKTGKILAEKTGMTEEGTKTVGKFFKTFFGNK